MLDGRKTQELYTRIYGRLMQWEERPWNEMAEAAVRASVEHELAMWGLSGDELKECMESLTITTEAGLYGTKVQVDLRLPPSAVQVDLVIRKEK